VAAGCAASPGPVDAEGQGIAELRVDATSLQAAFISRLTVESEGQTKQLVFNASSNTFDAALILPAGPHTVIARAFSDDTVAGASSPTLVEVEPGVATRVVLRIIDLRTETPAFGPIFESLTFPTTAQASTPVTFAISIIAPANDPVTYSWTSDCGDSIFGTPASPSTTWSKPTAGPCRISVVAASNGIATSQEFSVVVFPPGALTGAVNAAGVFVEAPSVELFFSELSCDLLPGANASCMRDTAAPNIIHFSARVFNWSLSTPGPISLSDNCGGRFGTTFLNSDAVQGAWLPPAAGGVCIVTARAVNSDGAVGTTSGAVLVRPGTPATSARPQISAFLGTGCLFHNDPPSTDCGVASAGAQASVELGVSWLDGVPGSVTLTDDCGGAPVDVPPGQLGFFRTWTLSDTPGAVCTVTVHATSLQGAESTASAHFQLL
jgi:hypothetical protein